MSMPMQKKIPSQDSRKRKRPRVPLDQRQRAPVACASCRRLKEKCDGNIPCQRCARYKRECIAVSHAGTSRTELLRDDRTSSTARIQDLEFIARHFLGNIPLSAEHLRRLVLSLRETEPDNLPVSQEIEDLTLDQERFTVKSLSSSVAHYSGELSHWNFSQRVRGEVSRRLENVTPTGTQESSILEYWRANHLQSRSSAINKVTSSLPPKDVALFLINVYFKYAQTNTFFVDEAWIMKKMDVLYRTHDKLCGDDAAWICTTLGVLAVGTEFAHMEKVALQPIASKDSAGDNAAVAAGVSFYKLAAELIPDIITIASVESVQAFLLLAHYTLPLDTAGLAYTYLGLALKMAVQNGMHRRYIGDLNPEMVDLRSRLWWTAYRLEKRVSILHGRPPSISSTEIDAEYPSDRLPRTIQLSRVLENAMTKVTDWLGDISVIIHMLRRSPKRLRRAYFDRVMQVRRQYVQWWQSAHIPPPTANSRAVAHLHMSHHLNLVFLGRPFIFQPQGMKGPTDDPESPRNKILGLVRDAVNSAQQIVDIASHLQATVGLARASYVEFSSCRAAMLVLLAQCLNEPCRQLRAKLTEGMGHIKQMAPANASTTSEASVMAAIEAAVKQLDSFEESSISRELGGIHDSFSSFMNWASGFQDGMSDVPSALPTNRGEAVARAPDIKETFAEVGWSPLDVSVFDEDSGCSDGFGSIHFEDAFSIAHAGGESFERPPIW